VFFAWGIIFGNNYVYCLKAEASFRLFNS
jgi:hypothetical protein